MTANHHQSYAVLGTQFGDEAKSKVIGMMLGERPYFFGNDGLVVVSRYAGGANAGHTQYVDGDPFIFHVVPSGIFKDRTYNLIRAGTIFDPIQLAQEIESIRKLGFDVTPDNFGISSHCHLTLGYHKLRERVFVQRKGGKISPTMKGIAPTYGDSDYRQGINFAEAVDSDSFDRLLGEAIEREQWELAHEFRIGPLQLRWRRKLDKNEMKGEYEDALGTLEDLIVDEGQVLALHKDANRLFEGAQGVMLDREYGKRPDVTSSHPAKPPGNAFRYGVTKAYMSRVGADAPPTQMTPDFEELIRGQRGEPGAEFGSTTGRPRYCCWLDIPILRHTTAVADIDRIALTLFDKLAKLPGDIAICDYYRIDGERFDTPPANQFDWNRIEPHYKFLPGFHGADLSGVRNFADLPDNAKDIVRFIRDEVDRDIGMISVGPKNEQTILIEDPDELKTIQISA